jgi:hypothetical protein
MRTSSDLVMLTCAACLVVGAVGVPGCGNTPTLQGSKYGLDGASPVTDCTETLECAGLALFTTGVSSSGNPGQTHCTGCQPDMVTEITPENIQAYPTAATLCGIPGCGSLPALTSKSGCDWECAAAGLAFLERTMVCTGCTADKVSRITPINAKYMGEGAVLCGIPGCGLVPKLLKQACDQDCGASRNYASQTVRL